MIGWDAGTTIAMLFGIIMAVGVIGFLAPLIETRNYAMPELTPSMPANYGVAASCPVLCDLNRSYVACLNNLACDEKYSCHVWWYWFCVVR